MKCVIFFLQINERKLLEFALKCSILVFSIDTVASSSLSRSVAHFQIFRRLMKGKFDAYDFGQKVPKLNSRPVYCSRLYGKQGFFGLATRYSVYLRQSLQKGPHFTSLNARKTVSLENMQLFRKILLHKNFGHQCKQILQS